jgi:hypothetical protein
MRIGLGCWQLYYLTLYTNFAWISVGLWNMHGGWILLDMVSGIGAVFVGSSVWIYNEKEWRE